MAELPLQEPHEEQHSENTPAAKPSPKKGIGWAWKVVIFLVTTLAIIQLIFRFYSDEIIGRVLKEVVLLKSDRLYRIDYDEISFDFLGQQLEIDQFRLIPNRAQYFNEETQLWKTKNSVFEANIPHIHLTGTSVIDLYLQNILNIDEFTITAPKVTAYLQKKDTVDRSKQFKINDLHFLIADRLNYLSIKDLAIERASLSLNITKNKQQEKYLFQNVSLAAINFLIDSASQQKDQRPFSVEDIHLEAKYNLVKLPNSPYSLQFEDLELSTYGGSFTVKGLRLTPSEQAQAGRGKFGNRNLAEIYVPYLRGTGVDYRTIYFNKSIRINQLKLRKPETILYAKKGRKNDPVASAKRLYKNIAKQFKSIEIEEIALEDAYLEYRQNNQEVFFLDHASGQLSHFLIDSASHQERGKFFFLDDIDVNIQEYEFPLTNQQHTLSSKEIGISTSKRQFFARHVKVASPYSRDELMRTSETGDVQQINLQVPLIKLDNFDIKKAYINREFEAGSVFLYQPKLSFFKHLADSIPEEAAPDSLNRIKDLYPYIQSAFKHVYINQVYLKEGNSTLIRQFGEQNGGIQIDTTSVRLKNIRIDQYTKFRKQTFLNTQNVEIEVSNMHFIRPDSLYQINIGKFLANQEDSSITLRDIHLKPLLDSVDFRLSDSLNLPPTFLDVHISELTLDSIDLNKAYYGGYVEIDQLLLKHPKIKLFKNPSFDYDQVTVTPHEKLQEFISKNFQALSLNRIILDSGSFSLMDDQAFEQERMGIDSIGMHISELLIDSSTLMLPEILFIVDSFHVDGRGYHLYLPDSIHQVRAERLAISSTAKEAFVEQIMLTADSSQLTSTNNHYFAQIPELRLKGFDPKLLYYDKILAADSLLLPFPTIQLELWQKTAATPKPSSIRWDELYQLVKPSLKAIEIEAALLDSGFVQVVQQGVGKGQTVELEELRVQVDNFILNEDSKPSPQRLFYADEFDVRVKNFYHFLPDSLYTIHLGELGFSAQKGNIWGLQVNVNPLNLPLSENYFNAYIPEFQLEGIDLFQLYQDKSINIKRFAVGAPWVKATSFPKAQTQDFSLDDLYPIISKFSPSLRIQQFQLAKGDFYLNQYQQLKPNEYHLGKVFLDVTNFVVDSTSSTKKKQFLADAVQFRLQDYSITLPDSLHELRFKELKVNTVTSSITMDSLYLEPLLAEYDYSKHIGHETDRVSLKIAKGKLNNVDLRKLLEGTAFDAQKLVFQGLHITAFRNKHDSLPPPPSRYKDLPREALLRLDYPVNLDTLELKNSTVVYQEHVATSDTMGYITLNRINVAAHHITNDPVKIVKGTSMDISLNCLIMNEGRLNVFVDMPLNSPDGEFYMEGIMDSMNLATMNPMLEPVAALQIRQGYARKMRFKMRGNDRFSTGIMRLIYKRLKVNVLNAGLKTILANAFVVIRNNPRRLIIRKGRMFYTRDTTRSVFSYWANTLLTGVKHSIGLKGKEKPDKEAKKKMLSQIVERFKLEGLAERKAEKDRKKALREQLKKQRKNPIQVIPDDEGDPKIPKEPDPKPKKASNDNSGG